MKSMKFKTILLSAAFVAAATFTSCEKTSEPQIGLKFNTVTSPVTLEASKKSIEEPRQLAFTSGFITLREVQFEVETDNDSIEVEFEIELNTKVDFATGETNPDISFVVIPVGTYNEMEVEIELQDEGDEPAMVLEGTYVDAQEVSHPVRFEFNSGETFEVEKEGVITFDMEESALAQITFDPTKWFMEVTDEQFSQATKDMEGVIVISETQNANIFDIAADGLDMATEVELIVD